MPSSKGAVLESKWLPFLSLGLWAEVSLCLRASVRLPAHTTKAAGIPERR